MLEAAAVKPTEIKQSVFTLTNVSFQIVFKDDVVWAAKDKYYSVRGVLLSEEVLVFRSSERAFSLPEGCQIRPHPLRHLAIEVGGKVLVIIPLEIIEAIRIKGNYYLEQNQ